MKQKALFVLQIYLLYLSPMCTQQVTRRVGKMEEVFAWTQLSYNINGNMVFEDRFGVDDFNDEEELRVKRDSDIVFFDNNQKEPEQKRARIQQSSWYSSNVRNNRPTTARTGSPSIARANVSEASTPGSPSTTASPADESGRFYIQYNNLPMGVERVGDRLFITVPRRRYGIPATLNYLDLSRDRNERSPLLRPYPSLRISKTLTSVYRTRADQCGRLWMVDTGLMEIPNNPQQVQPPAIVIFDLKTHRQIRRYPFKSSDLPAANTPTGLASITVDITNGDCANAFAYVPDLTTYGLIVYSLAENDSWRISHNYFHFNPIAGNLNVAGQTFQWSDGIFSITLTDTASNGCKTAYFHPLISTQEFAVSTCVLKNRTATSDSNYWSFYSLVGDRGERSQSTMHSFHAGTRVMFFADIGRDAVTCWNTAELLTPANVAVLAQDTQRLSYPSDLHVTEDEVWVMSNSLPRFGYARLDITQYNFFVYKGKVQDLIAGTVCDAPSMG